MKYQLHLVAMLFGIVMLCVGFGCGGSKTDYKLTKTPPFSLGEVYAQPWVAGIPSGGSGTNLHISFQSFTDAVVIDSIYFRNHIVKAQLSPEIRNQYVGYFKHIRKPDVIMDSDPLKEAQNTPPVPFPFDLEDEEAVISYFHYGEMRYYKIKKIEIKSMLAYPASNMKSDN
ncbi:hypothetical protein [Constantimarinum furrinae]|uniref:Lipoprotein n=1 Tax=Constantimarinum furrinae TaxID=2562285 RepID=A0A7G8PSY7_9FLAO|nr:hypothetical protein [Constantimarinum furrinae]QNJ97453.1 hypothetical protein ALE3EI_0878 [Constantimarinum furrinae]